jgi:hypothetical protein
MSFAKFLSMLKSRSLHFARADMFEDPYEGHWTARSVQRLRELLKRDPKKLAELLKFPSYYRQRTYISCWCEAEYESAALWDLYVQSNESIAIRTDYDTLSAELNASPYRVIRSQIAYVPYDMVETPAHIVGPLVLFTRKRQSFKHEQEFRALIIRPQSSSSTLFPRSAKGLDLEVDVERLIKELYVSPKAPEWFGEVVSDVTHKYRLKVHVETSRLYSRPLY